MFNLLLFLVDDETVASVTTVFGYVCIIVDKVGSILCYY